MPLCNNLLALCIGLWLDTALIPFPSCSKYRDNKHGRTDVPLAYWFPFVLFLVVSGIIKKYLEKK